MSVATGNRSGRSGGTGSGPGHGWAHRITDRQGAWLFAGEVVLVLVLWQILVGTFGVINPLFLPPPLAIANGFVELLGTERLATDVVASLTAWFIGYGLAVAVGIVLGLITGSSFVVDRLASPLLWSLYATPWLAYEPITKAWFGFGRGPVIFLVFIASVFPILLNASTGIRTTNRSLLNAGRVFGADTRQLYTKVLLPSTVPYILAGMRQGAVLATIAMIVAELTGASRGMGSLIAFTAGTYQTAQSYAAIALVVVWSVGVSQLIRVIGNRLAPWAVQRERA